MFTLKPYQEDCLDTLARYFKRLTALGTNAAPETAFVEMTRRPYHPVREFPGMPYICLHVPTAGGKTVLAANAIGIATHGEEADCAVRIDLNPKVKHWMRNLVRDNYGFALRIPDGYFFPDFVAELHDGRYLVVEYKGEHLEDTADTRSKEVVGKLWEGSSNGLCRFFMATKANIAAQFDSL